MADAERHVGDRAAACRPPRSSSRSRRRLRCSERSGLTTSDSTSDQQMSYICGALLPRRGPPAAGRDSRTFRWTCCGPSGTQSANRRRPGCERPRSRSRTLGFRFCGMMLLMPVSGPSSQQNPRLRVVVLDVEVFDELPDRGSPEVASVRGELGLDVGRRHVVGIVGVLDDTVEAEQRRQPRAIDGEAGRGQRGRAERAQVDPARRPPSGARRHRSSDAENASR